MTKKRLTLIVLLIVLAPAVLSLGLNGAKLSPITFRPGSLIINHYSYDGTNLPVNITVSPGPFRDISVANLHGNEFDLVINFPEDERVPSGSHTFSLSVSEAPDRNSGGIGSTVTVSKVFTVNVFSYGKEMLVSLSAPNVNEGSNVTLSLSASSVGYTNIESVRGIINVFDSTGNELAELLTEERALPALEGTTFYKTFESDKLPPNDYFARATVFYDGTQALANASFIIGNMDIIITNHTDQIEQGFSEFIVNVKSNWGNELKNVYAKVSISEEELLHTSSINLAPWEEGTLNGIMRVDMDPGLHRGVLQVFFEGESKEMPITIKIIKGEEVEAVEIETNVPSANVFLVIGIISLLIVVIIISYLLFTKRGEAW
jgi:hypothetical protein